jgi:hypothetical protein
MKKLLATGILLPLAALAQHRIGELDTLIQNAVKNHQASLTIPPGTYRGNTSGGSFIWVQHASNLHIIADSVTMICEKQVRAFEFTDCSNITLQGLTIDYDPLTYTQGDIVAVGSNYVDIKIHQGYPVQPWSRLDIIDPQTRYRKRGSIFAWNTAASVLGGDTVRVTNSDNPNITSVAVVGDMATLSSGPVSSGAPHAFVVTDCLGGMNFSNITVHAAPGFGIFEVGGTGGSRFYNCRVVPGPTPAGAIQERLLSSSWDAIQHKLTRTGPVVENCVVESAGDDTWSVTWDGDYVLGSVAGQVITLQPDNLQVGDSLRSSLVSDVVYVTAKSGSTVTLNKACPWPAGTHLYSPSRRCEHFVLRNNYFHSSGRVLVKAGHGLIEGNTFDNMHNGVSLDTELGTNGATGISDVVIRNNDIIGSGHFMSAWWKPEAGAISVINAAGDSVRPAGAFDNIVIENNRFTDVSGVNIVVTSADHTVIAENSFFKTGMTTPNETGGQAGIAQNTVVFLKNCNSLTLDSNVVHHNGLDSLLISKNVTGLTRLRRGIFDTDGQVFSNVVPYCCNNGGGNAFNNNIHDFVDAAAPDSAYTGIDFNRQVVVDSIRYYPRSSFEYRMTGGKFQGSADGINYTDLYTIPAAPLPGWSVQAVSGKYQYLRYLSPDGGFCNVAEIAFVVHEDSTQSIPPDSVSLPGRGHHFPPFSALKLFPNPLQHVLHILGLEQVTGSCELVFSDLTGRVLFRRIIPPLQKKGAVQVELPALSAGIYLLKISTASVSETIRLIKL